VKLYTRRSGENGDRNRVDSIDPETAIQVFHRWIQQDRLAEAVPIDIADYRHVQDGPQVVLVCHRGHYGLDRSDGEQGLLYSEKRGPRGPFRQRVRAALAAALEAAGLLEEEASLGVRFRTDRLLFGIQDRLRAPNTREVFNGLLPELAEIFSRLFPQSDVDLQHRDGDPRWGFGVLVHVPSPLYVKDKSPAGVKALIQRIADMEIP